MNLCFGRRVVPAAVVAGAVFSGCGTAALAKPSFPPVFRATYRVVPGSAIDRALTDCTLCHVPAGPPDRNSYGKAIEDEMRRTGKGMLDAAVLHAVEQQDSDNDGATNGAEIVAGTLPGDAGSAPTAGRGGAAAGDQSVWDLFTPRELLLPNHAQHRVLVHFPIALFVIGFVFDLIARFRGRTDLHLIAWYNVCASAITAPLTVITGILAWQIAYAGAPLTGKLLYHLVFGSAATLFIWLAWALRRRTPSAEPTVVAWVVTVAGLACLVVAGHIGGALV